VLLLWLLGSTLAAQASGPDANYQIDVWRADEGLPQSSVTSIAQSSDGYLWLGTQNGLVRFDGAQFKVFDERNTPAIKNSRIVCLYRDRGDTLWIGTEKAGLIRLRDGQFASYEIPSRQTTHDYPRVFCGDSSGALWLVSCEWQVVCFGGEKFSVPSTGWSLSGTRASAIAADRTGQVWVGTENELAVREGGAFRSVWGRTNESNFQVNFLAPSRLGGIWVAANGRLRRFASGGWVSDMGGCTWTNWPIYDLYEDSNNRLWVVTLGGGLFRYDLHGGALHLTTKEGLPTDSARCITEDREGNIWVGTEGGGLCRLKPALFETLGVRQGLSSDQVMSTCELREGGLLIGTDGGGLDRVKEGHIEHYGPDQGLRNGNVWSVIQDRRGSIWAGTWDGLYRLEPAGFTGLSDGANVGWQVLAIYEDHEGDLWVGQQAFGALSRMHEGKWTVVKIPGASASLDVRVVVQDRDGDFWIGTNDEGLYRLKDGRFTRFGTKDGLGNDAVWSLLVDREGTLWVGTCRGGLSRWRDGRFVTWTTREGLVNDVVCQILEDNRGNLWLGSYGGVFRISKAELNAAITVPGQSLHCVAYGKADGLPSIECEGGFEPSGCKTRDGRLWFPTIKGLAVVDPEAVRTNTLPPPVVIEEMIVDGVATTDPKIAPSTQRLGFRYTALSLTAPERVRFRYRVENLDKDWVDGGSSRMCDYSRLPPGDYRFHVIACNNDGVWNEKGATLALTVLPHFWQTGWFLSLTSLMAVASIAGMVRLVERRRIQWRLRRLERETAVERERARIAKDIHDDLGASLTEITILSELAQNPGIAPAQAQMDVRKIGAKARSLTQLLDEIVWAVNPKKDTLDNFVTYACTFAEDYLWVGKVQCRLELPSEVPLVPLSSDVRHSLFLVVKEALHNVLKHAGATEVNLRIAIDLSAFTLIIEDNGKGIEPERLRAFTEAAPGHRNGLLNMRQRIESIGGQFEIWSHPAEGTQVRLKVPIHPQ
jgi:ligand-binding sensor domain-containing protein/signal transduction histidine kinase